MSLANLESEQNLDDSVDMSKDEPNVNDEVENLFASYHKVEVNDLKNILGGSTD